MGYARDTGTLLKGQNFIPSRSHWTLTEEELSRLESHEETLWFVALRKELKG